jgi:hypothetical protein
LKVLHHRAVKRHGEQTPVVVERYGRVGKAQNEDIADRNDEQQNDGEHRRRHQEPGGQLLMPPLIAVQVEVRSKRDPDRFAALRHQTGSTPTRNGRLQAIAEIL